MGMHYTEKGIQHIGLPTSDMDMTISFYEELGFSVALDTVNKATGERITFLSLHHLLIEVYESKDTADMTGAIDHVALDVTDVNAAYKFMKSKGYQVLDSEIQFLPLWTNGVRFFTILGPNKEKIEFSQML